MRNTYHSPLPSDYGEDGNLVAPVLAGARTANLYGSLRLDGRHEPTLDIDHNCVLLPSTTPGHFHLYIDVPMSWENYQKLLDVMAEVGILEKGYVDVSKKYGATYVRMPHVKKVTPPVEDAP